MSPTPVRSLAAALANLLRRCFAPVHIDINPYRPHRHYMRGPGPKWHEKRGLPFPCDRPVIRTAGLDERMADA